MKRLELAILLVLCLLVCCTKEEEIDEVPDTSSMCAADPEAPVVIEVEIDVDRGLTMVHWEDSDADVIGGGLLRVDGVQCLISPETDADGHPLEGTCHGFGSDLTLECSTSGWVETWADCPSGASVELIDSSGNSGMGSCP